MLRWLRRLLAVVLVTIVAAVAIGAATGADAGEAWRQLRERYLAASRAEHDHRIKDWRAAESWTFDDGQMPEGFRVFDGQWDVRDGQLAAVDGKLDGNRTIGITNCRWPAFRMSFDAELRPREEHAGLSPARIGDIGIRINADPGSASFAQGYAVILAQYTNQATVIYRRNIPLARTEWSPIEAGRTHRVVVEVVKPHIRVWVDDRVVLEAWERSGQGRPDDRDFLEMDPQRLIALHTYDSTLLIDNLTISVPAQ